MTLLDTDEEARRKAKKAKKAKKLAEQAAAANGMDAKSDKLKKKKKKNRDHDDGDDEVSASDRKVKKNSNSAAKGLAYFTDAVNVLHAQKSDINDEMSALMADAKAQGYTPKAVKAAAKLMRDSEREKQLEFDSLVESYLTMLGVPGSKK